MSDGCVNQPYHGNHFTVCVCMCVCAQSLSRLQLFAIPWTIVPQDPLSLEFILKWVAISFSRRSSRPRNQTQIFCTGRWILYY